MSGIPLPPRRFPGRSRLRYWGARATGQLRRGDETLSIDRLTSPLRYDIAIRGDLLGWIAAELASGDRPLDHFVDGARSRPYGQWFQRIAVHRIGRRRAPITDPDEAFRRRVQRSIDLVRSYATHGFDTRYPITVHRCPPVLLDTGKRMGRRAYPVDGCHRLALLRADGITHLEPGRYLVALRPREPRDNTTMLLDQFAGDRERYYRFVGSGYDRPAATSRADLVDHVAGADPERLGELESVLAADEAILGWVPSDRRRR